MNPLEAWRGALANLAAHKLRSALTMLGMIFGVGAVIAMLSIGAGAERQALEMIDRLGPRNVLLRGKLLPDSELQEIRKKSLGVSERDAQAILEGVPGVELVAPRVTIDARRIVAAGAKTQAKVHGVSFRQQELSGLRLSLGRFLDPADEREHGQVAVIGARVARDLFGYEPPLGKRLKIDDVWFEVIGVLADAGGPDSFEGVSVGRTADEIYVPATTATRKFEREPLKAPLDEVVVRLTPDTPPIATAAAVRGLVDRLHSGAADFELVVPEALLEQSRRTQRLFNIVMGCIAGISLLVGGIGIMNIMLATVLERTREIGVRRAVGARRGDIRLQFMIESFAISVLGGLAGVVMGVAIAWSVAAYAGWPTVITATAILLSTGVSISVGLASGLYPAVRAATLDPIEALRYE
ncbi:MAG TPA: ABC transporter permease [Candidatus Polarisedimenticolaceae bacterium]|nr:ABC transporter permease [Candidatus Polarisedimenticolaceae bacterium]